MSIPKTIPEALKELEEHARLEVGRQANQRAKELLGAVSVIRNAINEIERRAATVRTDMYTDDGTAGSRARLEGLTEALDILLGKDRFTLSPVAASEPEPEEEMWVILFGSPIEGFKAHGPFPSFDSALDWAEGLGEGGEYVMRVHPVTDASALSLYTWSDDMPKTLKEVEERVNRLITGMRECERLDDAAGERQQSLRIGEWISQRMREAATRSLRKKDD